MAIKPVEASADTAPGTEGAEQAMIGQPAPEFTLKDLDGNPVSLKDLRGRVVLLDFWATWCGPCRMAMPHLEAFHKELADQGVKVFGINLRENAATVRKFMDAQKFTMPILLDADGKVAASYRVSGIPHTVIIGKDGQVLKVNVGYAPGVEEQLKQALLNAARQ